MSAGRSSFYDLNLADRQRDEVEVENGTFISTYLTQSQLDEVSKELTIIASRWVPELFPFGSVSRDNTELRMANIYGDGPKNAGSTVVYLRGSRAGWYSEWGSGGGRGIHKGPLGLLKDAFPHIPILEHAKDILERYGGRIPLCLVNGAAKKNGAVSTPPPALNEEAARRAATLDRARKELERCTALDGSVPQKYLELRGVDGIAVTEDMFALEDAYNPAINLIQPALVTRFRDLTGELTGGIHRTFVKPDGSWHSGKRMLGPTTGPNDLPGGLFLSPIGIDGVHGFGTGIETTLAAMKMFGVGGWSFGSDSHMDTLSKWIVTNKHLIDSTLLKFVRSALVFTDAGESGVKSGRYLVNSLASIGVEAALCLPRGGDDFADDLSKGFLPLPPREAPEAPVIDSPADAIPPGVNQETLPTVAECEAAIDGIQDVSDIRAISSVLDLVARGRFDPATIDVLLGRFAKKTKIKKKAAGESLRLKQKQLGVSSGAMVNANSHSIVIPYWYGDIVRYDNDEPKQSMFNCVIGFSDEVWNDVLWFNEFNDCVFVRKLPPYDDGADFKERMWDGADTVKSMHWLQQRGLNCNKDNVMDAVIFLAHHRQFNPILEYFTSLVWDGVGRLDTWLHKYLGCDDTPYHTAIGSKWLIGCVARVYEPGCKFDYALILEGPQGIGKSEVFHVLGGRWFTDDVDQLGTKDCAMQIHGAWIVEMAELSSMTYSDVNKAKAFITRQIDRFRPPYGREVREFPRMNGFAGTVNGMEYLKDDTGGRRFWPASVKYVAKKELVADRDQVIAEAIHRYSQGEKWWLDDQEVIDVAEEEQESRMVGDPWLSSIQRYISDAIRVSRLGFSTAELLEFALSIVDKAKWTPQVNKRVVSCLRQLGFTDETRPRKNNPNRERIYVSPKRKEAYDNDPARAARKEVETPKPPGGVSDE